MRKKLIIHNSHYLGNISNIQDSIILCDEPFSNSFIGEIVYFNNQINYKGIVFEINLKNIKILLLNCDQKNLFIGNFGLIKTIKESLGNPIILFCNVLTKYEYLCFLILYSFFFITKLNTPIKNYLWDKKSFYIFSNTNRYYSLFKDSNKLNVIFDYRCANIIDSINLINSFKENESNIFNVIIDTILKSRVSFVRECTNNVVENKYSLDFWYWVKSKYNGLYFLFFKDLDKAIEKNDGYIFIFYKKKIKIIINNTEYLLYCVYYLEFDLCIEGESDICCKVKYIYKKVDNDVFYLYDNLDIVWSHLTNNLEDDTDSFLREELLNSLSILVECGIENKINVNFLKKNN